MIYYDVTQHLLTYYIVLHLDIRPYVEVAKALLMTGAWPGFPEDGFPAPASGSAVPWLNFLGFRALGTRFFLGLG